MFLKCYCFYYQFQEKAAEKRKRQTDEPEAVEWPPLERRDPGT